MDFLNRFYEFAKGLGISEASLKPVSIAVLGLSLLLSLWKLTKQGILIRNRRLLNANLGPYFTRQDVQRATKYFIQTRYQNVSPSEDDDAPAQKELIPLFLKKVFNDAPDGNKYYLIFADSGMGKTTFLINLYLRYKNRWRNSLGFTSSHEIVLFPLGAPNFLQTIKAVPNQPDTILLLDAFDEDVLALYNHSVRMVEILEETQNFHTIVITCRTQFFPSEDEEPYKTGLFTFGGDGDGQYKFQKLYLSVFNDSDVRKYLRHRYSIFSVANYFKAKKIVKKCPNLVVRPMLLSRINDLIDSNRTFEHSFQIYETLIEKWIERESNKPAIQKNHESSEKYAEALHLFSKKLALDLYKNKDKRGGYFISKDEIISGHRGIQISNFEEEFHALSEKEARVQSLLNRNSKGQYKFSHKSFLEYFLAQELVENEAFYKAFDFDGMSAARNFYNEMLADRLSHFQGIYQAGKMRKVLPVNPRKIDEMVMLQIIGVIGFDTRHLSRLTSLRELIVFDEVYLPNLYKIYRLARYREGWDYSQLFERLKDHLKPYGILDGRSPDEFHHMPSAQIEDPRQYLHTLLKLLESRNEDFITELDRASRLVKDMKNLKLKLPGCSMFY